MKVSIVTYDPVAGTGYTQEQAAGYWHESMERARYEGPAWSIRGTTPAEFYWSWFNFKPWSGRVTVQADGFHRSTHEPYDGQVICEGVTTSLYEAYQSVVQGKEVKRAA